jgi:hypothetical protein
MLHYQLSDYDERPNISWADRNPTFGRTVRALFWKALLLKIRHPAAIVEFVLACVIIFPLYPVYMSAKKDYDGSLNPPLVYPKDNFTQNLVKTMAMYPDSKLVLFPESEWMKVLGGAFQTVFDTIKTKLAMTPEPMDFDYKTEYRANQEEMEKYIYSSDATGLGIRWINTEGIQITDPKLFGALQDPTIEYFAQ